MRREIKTVGVGLLAILLAGAGACKKEEKKEEMPPMEVDVATVATDSVMVYKDYPGKLRAKNVVEIVGRVDGVLKTKNYQPGDVVRQGQLLFTIDDTQYRNSVQQAQGQLENAISSTEYYKKQYAAMQKAFESDAVSQMEVLQAKSNLDEGNAQIKAYRAALQTAQTNMGYCRITAPFTGRITDTNVSPGGYISGSVSPVTLATLYDNSEFYADFYIDDATYIHITTGGKNGGAMDSIPLAFSEPLGHEYYGKMFYMAPDVDTGTGTMLIRVKVDNRYDELRDGMYATISLPYQDDPQALLVEDAAIGTDQLGKYVYVVGDDGVVKYTPIKIGALVSGNRRVVTDGLRAGQQYVTKALLKVRNGMKVKAKPYRAG